MCYNSNIMINRLKTKEPSVIYIEQDHSYVHKTSGEFYSSMTSITDFFPKDFLVKWAVNKTCDYFKGVFKPGIPYTPSEVRDIVYQAKEAYISEQYVSTQFGKICHDWIENHISGADGPMFPEHKKALEAFLKWEDENIREWLASEIVVSLDELKIAGRLDAVAMLKNGMSAIIDFKTSNAVHSSYKLQTAGYWAGLNELGFCADSRIILRLPKINTRKRWDKKMNKYIFEKDELEEYIVTSNLEKDINIIKCQKALFDWVKKND